MNHNPILANNTAQVVVLPPGWKAEWSVQYARYFYINLVTNESTWVLPTLPPQVHHASSVSDAVQQRPPQTQPSPAPSQDHAIVKQAETIEACLNPQPQVTSSYFSPPPSSSPLPQSQSVPGPAPTHQPQPNTAPQQPQHAQGQNHVSAQPRPSAQPLQQYPPLQHNGITPAATPGSMVPNNVQPSMTPINPPVTSNVHVCPTPLNYAVSPYQQSGIYPQATVHTPIPSAHGRIYPAYSQGSSGAISPQQQPSTYVQPHQQSNNFGPPQQMHQPSGYPLPSLPYQQPMAYTSPDQAQSQQQSKGPSMMGGNIMTKMSSKLTSLQKNVTSPDGGNSTDWKKWGKRAAIGVAGIGALALGVDAAGDMADGLAGMSLGDGGAGAAAVDYSGGGEAAAVMGAQSHIAANSLLEATNAHYTVGSSW